MKKLIFVIFTLGVMFGLTGCGDEPKDFLKDSIESHIEILNQSNNGSVQIKKQSKIKKDGELMTAIVTLEEVSELKGQKLVMNLHLKASSKDNGTTWYLEKQ